MSQQENARQAGLKDAQDWLLDVMGDWDFTIPNGAFDKIAGYIAAQSADASNAAENSFLLGCNDVVGATRCRLAHETGHPIAKSDDMVLVRRDMVSAACHAISNQKEAHKVLTYLRAVAMSDASNAATGQPVAWRREWDGDQSDYGIWVYVDSEDAKDSVGPWQPLYAAPAAPASEPFSIDGSDYDDVEPEPASEPAGDMYLCKAWGETDLPAAAIVTGMYGVRAFLISEWLGSADATQDDGTNSLDEAMEDMQEQWDREGEAWEWSAEFEIGGISVQKIGCAAPAPAAQAGDIDTAERLAFESTNDSDNLAMYKHWFRKGYQAARLHQSGEAGPDARDAAYWRAAVQQHVVPKYMDDQTVEEYLDAAMADQARD